MVEEDDVGHKLMGGNGGFIEVQYHEGIHQVFVCGFVLKGEWSVPGSIENNSGSFLMLT